MIKARGRATQPGSKRGHRAPKGHTKQRTAQKRIDRAIERIEQAMDKFDKAIETFERETYGRDSPATSRRKTLTSVNSYVKNLTNESPRT